jgi:hypothetical protein
MGERALRVVAVDAAGNESSDPVFSLAALDTSVDGNLHQDDPALLPPDDPGDPGQLPQTITDPDAGDPNLSIDDAAQLADEALTSSDAADDPTVAAEPDQFANVEDPGDPFLSTLDPATTIQTDNAGSRSSFQSGATLRNGCTLKGAGPGERVVVVRGDTPVPRLIRIQFKEECRAGIAAAGRAYLFDRHKQLVARAKCLLAAKASTGGTCKLDLNYSPRPVDFTNLYYVQLKFYNAAYPSKWQRGTPPPSSFSCKGYNTPFLYCRATSHLLLPEHRCDLSRHSAGDPGANRDDPNDPNGTGSRRAEPYPSAANPTAFRDAAGLPLLDPTGMPIVLRWGKAKKVKVRDFGGGSWEGYGYRKIKAKHGWSERDRAATEAALRNPPVKQRGSAYTYLGPRYRENGVPCQRLVVVETAGQKPGDSDVVRSQPERQALHNRRLALSGRLIAKQWEDTVYEA